MTFFQQSRTETLCLFFLTVILILYEKKRERIRIFNVFPAQSHTNSELPARKIAVCENRLTYIKCLYHLKKFAIFASAKHIPKLERYR